MSNVIKKNYYVNRDSFPPGEYDFTISVIEDAKTKNGIMKRITFIPVKEPKYSLNILYGNYLSERSNLGKLIQVFFPGDIPDEFDLDRLKGNRITAYLNYDEKDGKHYARLTEIRQYNQTVSNPITNTNSNNNNIIHKEPVNSTTAKVIDRPLCDNCGDPLPPNTKLWRKVTVDGVDYNMHPSCADSYGGK